jgi:hypothetical protein
LLELGRDLAHDVDGRHEQGKLCACGGRLENFSCVANAITM